MKIKWLGHAAFLITSESGTKIITDPYAPDERLHYGEIREAADIVTVSHDHFDHSNVAAVRGNPQVIRGTAEVKGIKFKTISSYHDKAEGKERGNNRIFCFEVDGIRVCHLGDLGHPLTDKQAAEMGRVDVLFLPVGGFYTIDAVIASRVSDRLKPRVVIPMHFKNSKCNFPISGVEEFLKGKKEVSQPGSSEIDLRADSLPAETRIMVLQPAL
jgi:L-ascorbate metabolism protein UlaG (beta-lactamase superfamily)